MFRKFSQGQAIWESVAKCKNTYKIPKQKLSNLSESMIQTYFDNINIKQVRLFKVMTFFLHNTNMNY